MEFAPAIEALPNSARFAYIRKLRFSSAFTNEIQQVKPIIFVKFSEIKPLNVGVELVQPSFQVFLDCLLYMYTSMTI